MQPQSPRKPYAVVALVAAAFLILAIVALRSCGGSSPKLKDDPESVKGASVGALQQLRPDYKKSSKQLDIAAAAGFANPLYNKVPGGAVETAARVARYRELIEATASQYNLDADMLEALVYLESAGRPTAMASDDLKGAAGLTQIVAETGTNLLDMKIDVAQSQKLSKQISRSRSEQRVLKLQEKRRLIDPRFDPPQALEGAAKYLVFAKGELGGRDDLAFTSYHMGVGNLQNVLKLFGAGNVSYGQLYFGSDPIRTPEVSAKLMEFSDDSSSYYWRLLAAKRIMQLSRQNPQQLAAEAELQSRKASSEDFMHPDPPTKVFQDAGEIKSAVKKGTLRRLPAGELKSVGVAINPQMGELAKGLGEDATTYRALNTAALDQLTNIGAATQAITAAKLKVDAAQAGTLSLTSTVRDLRYQSELRESNTQAAQGTSQHTTGWAMDFLRKYGSRDQAQSFQWVLTRLQALNRIAWVREPEAIHVTVHN